MQQQPQLGQNKNQNENSLIKSIAYEQRFQGFVFVEMLMKYIKINYIISNESIFVNLFVF